jgi:hypothetical protein
MSNVHGPVTYRGRSLGIVTLTVVQLLIGVIHVFSGLWLLTAGSLADFILSAQSPLIYSIYTFIFGLLTLVFAIGIWLGSSWGWIGTVAVSVFVVVADTLTLLNLPSIPDISRLAAAAEIMYSLIILLYLSQTHVRIKYKISK